MVDFIRKIFWSKFQQTNAMTTILVYLYVDMYMRTIVCRHSDSYSIVYVCVIMQYVIIQSAYLQ